MNKKELREFVKENTSLKEIVKASGFRSVLQGLANSSLNYYGFKSVPIRTDFALTEMLPGFPTKSATSIWTLCWIKV